MSYVVGGESMTTDNPAKSICILCKLTHKKLQKYAVKVDMWDKANYCWTKTYEECSSDLNWATVC